MAGMSDSVHIFVPILKEAADVVQSAVEDLRQSERDAAKTIEYEQVEDDDDDDDATGDTTFAAKSIPTIDDSHNSTDTAISKQLQVIEAPNDKQPVITGILQPSPLKQQPLGPLATSTKSNVPLISAPKSERDLKPRTKPKKSNALVKEKLTDATGRETPSLVKAAIDSIWPPSVWTIVAALVVCFLYANWHVLSGKTHLYCEPAMKSQVVSHAVYLRDLDEGFIKKSLQPPYYGSER
jgi:hypothetical protein